MKKIVLLLLLCALLLPLSVGAQNFDPDAEPNFGTLFLDSSFPIDPYIDPMISGGPIDASGANLGVGCTGFIAQEPDLNLDWTGSAARLRLFFVSSGDTTLVVRDPSGVYHCDDDGGISLNGAVEFTSPLEGVYNIWIGSFRTNEFISGYLMMTQSSLPVEEVLASVAVGGLISDGSAVPEGSPGGATGGSQGGSPGGSQGGSPGGSPAGGGTLNASGAPLFGSVSLAPAFTPDPQTIAVVAGGSVDAFGLNLGNACRGYLTAEPTYVVDVASGLFGLSLYAVSAGDTTLVVQLPDGTYACNDDFSGRNPGLSVDAPQAGTYAIWVGTFSQSSGEDATLYITEVPTLTPDMFPN